MRENSAKALLNYLIYQIDPVENHQICEHQKEDNRPQLSTEYPGNMNPN